MDADIKYWNDYTEFIKISEELTGFSPAELVERYKILINELETNNLLEWIYEDLQNEYTVTKIHKLMNLDLLKGNILKNNFEREVNLLNIRFVSFLEEIYKNTDSWWVDFNKEKIKWGR